MTMPSRNRRPNVVLFITHDTGFAVSPYGWKTVQTPACERLAREGVRFNNSFCTAPLCAPSRAALVTGRHPHQNGVMGLTGQQTGGFDLYEGEKHAARLFADAGYEPVLCGFEHESPLWEKLGFERAISGGGGWFNGGGDTREHAGHIDAFLGQRDGERPFFLQIGSHETHHAWTAYDTEPDDSLGLTIPSYLKDTPDVRREVAEFQGAVRRLDQCLGDILEVLDRRGVADDTLFVFTTDHGIDFPRAKGTCYDAGIAAFLFMRYPAGDWSAGATRDELISNVDVLPTLLEACGIDAPTNLAGRSFMPLLQADAASAYEPRDAVFAGKTYHDTYDPQRCVRTARFKYIRHFAVNIFIDLRLATMTRRDQFATDWRRRTDEELYDLQTDPHERTNLAADSVHADTLDAMRRRLLQWMRDTDDPLLRGPAPSPYYARRLQELLELTP